MSVLLRKPTGTTGKVHDVTPTNAGWRYVGFGLHRLTSGTCVEETTESNEVIIVLVEGCAELSVDGKVLGDIGRRMNVFEKIPPASVYVPAGSCWSAVATTFCTIGVCSAPGRGGHSARVLPEPVLITRGRGANTRHIYPIAMEDQNVADSLLVTEVFTPQGNWSSYPPHRHDVDDFPRMTYLEETYYHRLCPTTGFVLQRVFTDDLSLDETMAVADGDVVLVPRGHHPCAAPYGFEMYYLNVMAGPLRKWRFQNHPDFDWIAKRDS